MTDQTHIIADEALARQRLPLWLNMLKAVRHVESTLRENLRAGHDMTLPRFDVLAALHAAAPKGMKMSELSDHLVVSNGNVTGVVDRLVKDGFVERRAAENDRRAFVVSITENGQAQMDQMMAEHLAWIDELFQSVSGAQTAEAIAVMLGIRQMQQVAPARASE